LDVGRFFSRRRADFLTRPASFLPAEAPNIDEMLFAPVSAFYWRQYELWDGTYTLDDLLDILEVMAVARENDARARESH